MFLLICVGWIHFWFTLILDLLFWRVILTDDQHWNLFRSACFYSTRDSRRCNMLQHADVCSPLLNTINIQYTHIYLDIHNIQRLGFPQCPPCRIIFHISLHWSPWHGLLLEVPWSSGYRFGIVLKMRVVGSRYLMIHLANTSGTVEQLGPSFSVLRVLNGFYEDFHWCKQEMFSPSNSVRCLVTLLFSHGGTFRSLSKYGGKVGDVKFFCPVQFQIASHYFWGCWTVVDCCDLPIYAGDSFHWGVFNDATLPETYIAPANGWLEYLAILFGWPIFGGNVSFRECNPQT